MKKIAYLLAIILSLYMIISILHVKSIPKDLCITNTINNCLDIEHDNYYSLNGLTINTKIRCMEDTSIPSLFRMEIPKKIVHYYHNTYLYNIHYNARYVYNYLEKGEALLPHIKLIDNSIINKNQADVVGLLINKSLSNVDFSQCGFVNMIIDNTIFENCNFDNTIINSPKFVLYGTNNKTHNMWFINKYSLIICDSETLKHSKNYQNKELLFHFEGSCDNLDLSDFYIGQGFYPTTIAKTIFENTFMIDIILPSGMTESQFKSTKNYRIGSFINIDFIPVEHYNLPVTILENADISRMSFCGRFECSMKNTKMVDTVFTRCDLSKTTGLTIEQIQSTWNYKNNRMEMIKLPPYLQDHFKFSKKYINKSLAPKCHYHTISIIDANKSDMIMQKANDWKSCNPDKAIDKIIVNQKAEKFMDNSDYSGKIISSSKICYGGNELKNVNFSGCDIVGDITEIVFINCNFRYATFTGKSVTIGGSNNDLTGSVFSDNTRFECSAYNLSQTSHFQNKILDVNFHGYCENLDLSNFIITSPANHIRIRSKEGFPVNLFYGFDPHSVDGACFENADMFNIRTPFGFTNEQLRETLNFKTGCFNGVDFVDCESYFSRNFPQIPFPKNDSSLLLNTDISAMSFSGLFVCSFKGVIMKNTVFTMCDLSHSTNLTVEQIKSTWNYKNNRMDLIKLPPDLQKYFDEEKKEKE